MVYFEWQLWLWNLILKFGYHLYVKPHPEGLLTFTKIEFPESINILNGYFEEYLKEDCIFIFDTASSSALTYALASSHPIVFIDDKVNELDKNVKEEMKSRVELVKGYYDKRNRLRVNENEFMNALLNCSENKTYDFVENYFCKKIE